MTVPLCIGIDPGLVHTGVVGLRIREVEKTINIYYVLVDGIDEKKVQAAVQKISRQVGHTHQYVWIEEYRPRSHLSTDQRMVTGVAAISNALPTSKVLSNTGIKSVVKDSLLEMLELNTFAVSTHHNDLVSAARILLLGMLKDENLNALLTQIALDYWVPTRTFTWAIETINLT